MAQLTFALRFGYSDGTTMAVVGYSLSSTDIVIALSVGGGVTLNGMAQLGTDDPNLSATMPEAMFVDSDTLSSLTASTEYSYTATQGANSITGTFRTAPEAADDFSFFVGTCDNVSSLGGDAAGMYTHIKDYMQNGALPTACLIHLDDHYGYVDRNAVDDTAGTGHRILESAADARDSATVYDYAVGVAANLGLYSDAGDPYVAGGHDTDRQYVFGNLPVWPQWGDHDLGANNMGWDVAIDGAGGPPTSTTQYTNAKAVWDKVLLPLQPTAIDGANSNAWGANLGCTYIAAMDGVSTASGNGTVEAAPTTLFGATQIASVLSGLNNTQPFKILGLANGIRYLTEGVGTFTENSSGSQLPIALHATEYQALFTDNNALMDLPQTNGKQGTFLTVHGDYHGLKMQKNLGTNGTHDEWFYSINSGTLTGAINFKKIPASTTPYEAIAGEISTVEYSDGSPSGTGDNQHNYWALRFDVYGSRYPKELHVYLLDKTNTEVFSRKFVHQITGNECVTINTVTSDKKSSMSIDGIE